MTAQGWLWWSEVCLCLADFLTVFLLHLRAHSFDASTTFSNESFGHGTNAFVWAALVRVLVVVILQHAFRHHALRRARNNEMLSHLLLQRQAARAHMRLTLVHTVAQLAFLLAKLVVSLSDGHASSWFYALSGVSLAFALSELYLLRRSLAAAKSLVALSINGFDEAEPLLTPGCKPLRPTPLGSDTGAPASRLSFTSRASSEAEQQRLLGEGAPSPLDGHYDSASSPDALSTTSSSAFSSAPSSPSRMGGRLRYTEENIKEGTVQPEWQKHRKATFFRLLRLSAPDRWIIFWAFLFLTIAAVASTSLPHFTGMVVDSVAIDDNNAEFRQSLGYLAGAAVVCAVFTGLRGMMFSFAIARLKVRMREKLLHHVLMQEIAFFDAERTGELTSRLSADTTKVGDAIGMNVNVFVRTVVQIIGVLIFMSVLSWRLTLVTFTVVPMVVFVSHRYGEYMRKMGRLTQEIVARSTSVAEEALGSMHTVRCFAAEQPEFHRFHIILREFYDVQVKEGYAYAGFMFLLTLLPYTVTIIILLYGGHLVNAGTMSPGDLVSFLFYQSSLTDCFNNFSYVYSNMSEAFGASDKVFELLDRVPTMNLDGTHSPAKIEGLIEFRDVGFAYPTRSNSSVMRHFNLVVRPGEMVALVGPSGGGKSTAVRLIERLYDPDEGAVYLDGVDVREYDSRALHRGLSIVSQEPTLYARSIKDNITFGLDEGAVSMDDVMAAAAKANAHEFIMSFPEAYNTEVGEKGVQLSGGQRQRIAIARALVRNPSVLLLDEATSALDAESEHIVQAAIDNVMVGRTVVVVAHRLSTVRNAHRIVVIRGGQIVEEGRHEELLAANGVYSQLVYRQLRGVEKERKESKASFVEQ